MKTLFESSSPSRIDTVSKTDGTSGNTLTDIFEGKIFKATPGTIPSALIQGVAYGLTAYIALKMIISFLGVDDNTANAISAAGGAGFFANRKL